ncbi:MAG: integrase core domain-containing protein, partial [Steroidobacteraceae bacterium]
LHSAVWRADECLNREWFCDVREARVLIKRWRSSYNQRRPHSVLGYRTPIQARRAWMESRKPELGLTA